MENNELDIYDVDFSKDDQILMQNNEGNQSDDEIPFDGQEQFKLDDALNVDEDESIFDEIIDLIDDQLRPITTAMINDGPRRMSTTIKIETTMFPSSTLTSFKTSIAPASTNIPIPEQPNLNVTLIVLMSSGAIFFILLFLFFCYRRYLYLRSMNVEYPEFYPPVLPTNDKEPLFVRESFRNTNPKRNPENLPIELDIKSEMHNIALGDVSEGKLKSIDYQGHVYSEIADYELARHASERAVIRRASDSTSQYS
jgi:hypothetical protein